MEDYMDATSLLTSLVSASNIKNISTASNASTTDVKNVLTQAIPALIQGASAQASGDSAEGFQHALEEHSKDKSKTLDIEDGAKIISHLLGSKASSTTNSIAKASGVAKSSVSSILAAAAPLFMSLLGKQTSGNSGSALASIIGGLSSTSNLTGILGNLLGGGTSSSSSSNSGKDSGGGLLGGLMGLLK